MKGWTVLVVLGPAVGLGWPVGSVRSQTPRHPMDRDLTAIRRDYRRFGPLAWRPRLGLAIGVDSNPFPGAASPARQDIFGVIQPSLDLALVFRRTVLLGLQGGLGYQHYFRYRQFRGAVYDASAYGAVRLGPSKLGGGVRWDSRFYPYTPEVDVPLRVMSRTSYGSWEIPIRTRLTLEARVGWTRWRFQGPGERGLEFLQNVLNYSVQESTGVLRWERSPRTVFYVVASRRSFRFTTDTWRNSQDREVAVGWTYRVTSFAGAQFRVGYRWLRPVDPGRPGFQDWVGSLRADLAVGRRWWLLAAGERRPEWTVYLLGSPNPVFTYTRWGIGLGWTVLRGIRVRGFYERFRLRYAALPGFADQGRSWQAGIDFRVRNQVIGVTFADWRRDASGPLVARRRWTLTLTTRGL